MQNSFFSSAEMEAMSSGLCPPPPHDYILPTRFPDLSRAKRIAFDFETKDPNIVDKGAGVYRKDGRIVGGSIAAWDHNGELMHCVAPETRILRSDLTWVGAASVQAGDTLFGFDEELNGKRYRVFKPSVVEHVLLQERPCVEVCTTEGTIVCAEDHAWLAEKYLGKSGNKSWIESQDLKVGHGISFLSQPWETDTSFEAGYLKGIFDGEGSINKHKLQIAQKRGPVLNEIYRLLDSKGFDTRHHDGAGNDVELVEVKGKLPERLRFLGSIRPLRLLKEEAWSGLAVRTSTTNRAVVLSIKRLGIRRVVSIKTSSSTFVAEGLLSHNSEYYPIAHRNGPNLDESKVLSYFANQLNFFEGELVGANLLYDGDWMQSVGIVPAHAQWRDIQWAEALIDEMAFNYKLETIAQKYLHMGKLTNHFAKDYGPDYIKRFDEVHPGHARVYGIGDVLLPNKILDCQYKELESLKLMDLFKLESRLTPFLLYMRKQGVRIDTDRAMKFKAYLEAKLIEKVKLISQYAGMQIATDKVNDKRLQTYIFDKLRIAVPRTAKTGEVSITDSWLHNLCKCKKPDPKEPEKMLDNQDCGCVGRLLESCNKYRKAISTFIDGYVFGFAVDGRIHGEFHPLRKSDGEGDEAGTESGRFSGSHPNLQNIPARDEEIGPMCRSMFVPEVGGQWWSVDLSQIEYRYLVHMASIMPELKGEGEAAVRRRKSLATVKEVIQRYKTEPSTDFHQALADLVSNVLGKKFPRKDAKNLNFGLCLAPNTKILTADLRWKTASRLSFGDRLIGFDEHPKGRKRRRFQESFVENVERFELPCVKIVTTEGSVICSEDHFWMARQEQGTKIERKSKTTGVRAKNKNGLTYEWARAKDLRVGQVIPCLGAPWPELETKDAGWLSGIFDGEGYLSSQGGRGKHNSMLGVVQNEGTVLNKIRQVLSSFGFSYSEHPRVDSTKECTTLLITGGRDEFLRFLGSIRPVRLLQKSDVIWNGAACWSAKTRRAKVLSIESIGMHEVVSIRTSTRTFIAEGLLSHNCYGMGLQHLADTLNMLDENGKPNDKVKPLMETYHGAAPFVKDLYDLCIANASTNGEIRTILGRRSQFEFYQPRWRAKGKSYQELPFLQAVNTYGFDIERCQTHKALNRLLQGSAADHMKAAMVKIWESGVLNNPNDFTISLTVHDELDGSIFPTKIGKECLEEVDRIMRTAIPLNLPVLSGIGVGADWSEAK